MQLTRYSPSLLILYLNEPISKQLERDVRLPFASMSAGFLRRQRLFRLFGGRAGHHLYRSRMTLRHS